MPDQYLTYGLFAVLAVMIFFMFRNSKKRQAEAEAMRAKIQPGAEVMTQHGIYGTLVEVDQDKNEAIIETTPGTRLRVHSQTIAKVVEDDEPIADEADAADEPAVSLNEDTAIRHDAPRLDTAEPEFGERTDTTKRTPREQAGE